MNSTLPANGVVHEPGDPLQDLLAGPVLRVRLAGEHQLDRRLGIAGDRGNRLDVLQDEVRPLVGGEAPREADGQRVQAQRSPQPGDQFRRLAAPLRALDRLPPRDVDQTHLERLVRFPQLAIVDELDRPRIPARCSVAPAGPSNGRTPGASAARPGVDMDPVGDV
jgi:hypothetical protein